jgi:hypothetical protein
LGCCEEKEKVRGKGESQEEPEEERLEDESPEGEQILALS